jgi:ribosomal protein L11 methyltransferase
MELELPGELEESLLWRLESLGIVRVAVQFRPEQPARRTLVAWLPEIDWPVTERQRLHGALADMAEPFQLPLPPLSWQRQLEEDWAQSWKRHWQPDPVGLRLLILPAWLEKPPEHSHRLPLLIDPGSAFGTGSHPTTRLCIEGLEAFAQRDVGLKGTLVADLGCGSGILGLAALALGADRVCAVDTDSLAVRATGDNAALNRVTESLQVAEGSAEALAELLQGRRAGVLLCNILAPVLAELGPQFEGLLAAFGVGLLSGLLIDQVEPLVAVLQPLGWRCTLAAEQSRWALLRIQRHGVN